MRAFDLNGDEITPPADLVCRGSHLVDEALQLLPRVARLSAEMEALEVAIDRTRITLTDVDEDDVDLQGWCQLTGARTLRDLLHEMAVCICYHAGSGPSDGVPDIWAEIAVAERWLANVGGDDR